MNDIVLKISFLGDAGVGKSSILHRFVDDKFQEDYVYTLGISFKEKRVNAGSKGINLVLYDIGGSEQFESQLSVCCSDANALIYCFDLVKPISLLGIKKWFKKARKLNKKALSVLVGTKFDKFFDEKKEDQAEIINQAKKYAKVMKCPLIFISAQANKNINTLFKIIMRLCFKLDMSKFPEETRDGRAMVIIDVE